MCSSVKLNTLPFDISKFIHNPKDKTVIEVTMPDNNADGYVKRAAEISYKQYVERVLYFNKHMPKVITIEVDSIKETINIRKIPCLVVTSEGMKDAHLLKNIEVEWFELLGRDVDRLVLVVVKYSKIVLKDTDDPILYKLDPFIILTDK